MCGLTSSWGKNIIHLIYALINHQNLIFGTNYFESWNHKLKSKDRIKCEWISLRQMPRLSSRFKRMDYRTRHLKLIITEKSQSKSKLNRIIKIKKWGSSVKIKNNFIIFKNQLWWFEFGPSSDPQRKLI